MNQADDTDEPNETLRVDDGRLLQCFESANQKEKAVRRFSAHRSAR